MINRSGYVANHPDHGLPKAKPAVELAYYVRVVGGKPVALERHRKGLLCRVLSGEKMSIGKLVWIADRPDAQAVAVALEWFDKNNRTTYEQLTKKVKMEIKRAIKQGQPRAAVARAQNITEGTLKRVLRWRR